eukprot:3664893-Rhodomonas_salina.1
MPIAVCAQHVHGVFAAGRDHILAFVFPELVPRWVLGLEVRQIEEWTTSFDPSKDARAMKVSSSESRWLSYASLAVSVNVRVTPAVVRLRAGPFAVLVAAHTSAGCTSTRAAWLSRTPSPRHRLYLRLSKSSPGQPANFSH